MTRNESMCSSLLENVDTWNTTLKEEIKSMLGDVTQKTPADWHAKYEEIFGKRKLYESQAASGSGIVDGIGPSQVGETGEESWEDVLKGLPPQWRRKIMKVLEKRKKKKIDKQALVNLCKTKHKLSHQKGSRGSGSAAKGNLQQSSLHAQGGAPSVSVPPSSEAKHQDVDEDDDYDADGFAKLLEQELEG